MKLAMLLVVFVTACQSGGGDDYPIGPGGGGGGIVSVGGGGSGSVDAGAGDAGGDGDSGVPITGRVCLLTDLRKLTTCSATGAKGLAVLLGTRTVAIDHDDGTFTIAAPLGTDLTWHVKSSQDQNIITSAMPFGADNTIPVVRTALYQDLLNANGVMVLDQQGSVVVRVVSGVTPVANVKATSSVASSVTLYDTGNTSTDRRLDWNDSPTGGTGPAGAVWFPDVPLAVRPPTLTTITLTPQSGTSVFTPVAVENQTITFVTKNFE
jgi:hypothetical protein